MELKHQLYTSFASTTNGLPVFAQPWWLNAVATYAQWDVAMVTEGEGTETAVLAAWPYMLWRKNGFRFITNPPLTPRLGIFFAHPFTYREQDRLTQLLVQQLPKYDFLDCQFHYPYDYWQPLRWLGMQQTTRYSYALQAGFDAQTLLQRFNANAQRNLKKAATELQVKELTDVLAFYSLAQLSFGRKNKRIPYSLDFLANLDNAAAGNQARKIFFALDAQGQFHAAIYCVEDNDTVYYLAGGMDPAHKDSGAMTLLFWHAIQWAAHTGRSFDCEGSDDPGIAQFFMNFGTRAKPYHNIFHYRSQLFKVLHSVSNFK